MEKLDLERINHCAPYEVKEDSQEGAYTVSIQPLFWRFEK